MDKYLLNNDSFTNKTTDNIDTISVKSKNVLQKHIYELVFGILVIAMFFLEQGRLAVKDQSIFVLIGNCAVLFVSTLIIDKIYWLKGDILGSETLVYKEISQKHRDVVDSLIDEDLQKLENECTKYNDELFDKTIRGILKAQAITYECYLKNYKGKDNKSIKKTNILSKRQQATIIKCNNLKLTPITSEQLTEMQEGDTFSYGGLGKNAYVVKKEHFRTVIISKIFTALIFSYLGVELLMDWSWASFGWFMFKVGIMVYTAIAAYLVSYMNRTRQCVDYKHKQLHFLCMFTHFKTE